MVEFLFSLGFKICDIDPCFFILVDKNGQVSVYIGLNVDDLLIVGRLNADIQKLKNQFDKKFPMKDLGLVRTLLEMQI